MQNIDYFDIFSKTLSHNNLAMSHNEHRVTLSAHKMQQDITFRFREFQALTEFNQKHSMHLLINYGFSRTVLKL